MNNELERILGEVADSASHRTGTLPVGELRARGVRRRRTRQAGYSVVGVAAAFGLAFGAAQILPDAGPVGPADSPTEPLPTADSSLPLGACGSVVSNLPVVDSNMSLEMAPTSLRLAVGELPVLTMTLFNYGPGPLELEADTVAFLMVVKDDVVVGLSKPMGDEPLPVVAEGKAGAITGFGPVFQCSPGEHLARDDSAATRVHLSPGQYTTYAALGGATTDLDSEWAFSFIGRDGTLTVTDEEPASEDLAAVEVSLPVCGEPVAGFEFPAGAHLDTAAPIGVTVGHSGEEAGNTVFYVAGYGDQVSVVMNVVSPPEPTKSLSVTTGGAVIARDGIVVAEVPWTEQWANMWFTVTAPGERLSIDHVEDWVDCASGEHSQVPKGDYEILGWQQVEWQRPDGSTVTATLGYPVQSFTAYDFEDPDNPGPSATD